MAIKLNLRNIVELTIKMPCKIVFRGTFFIVCDLIEIGMQTPMIHKKDGKMKSAGCIPFHVACSSQSYLPAPLFANIIVTMAKPRNVSKLHSREDVRRAIIFSLSFFRRSSFSSSKWSVDAVAAAFLPKRLRTIIFTPLIIPVSIAPMAHTNSKAIN